MPDNPTPRDHRLTALYRHSKRRAELLRELAKIDAELNRIRREEGLPQIP